MSLAPGAIVTSPVRVCVPAQVSVPVMVPEVVSLDALTGWAGSVRESRTLVKKSAARAMEAAFPLRTMAPDSIRAI